MVTAKRFGTAAAETKL